MKRSPSAASASRCSGSSRHSSTSLRWSWYEAPLVGADLRTYGLCPCVRLRWQLRTSSVGPSRMRVLAVGAHPDDLEILCGGTLARFVKEGHDVVMCHATLGDRGSFVHSSEEIARIRGVESKRAAEICGAEEATLGLHDAEVNAADPEQRRLV